MPLEKHLGGGFSWVSVRAGNLLPGNVSDVCCSQSHCNGQMCRFMILAIGQDLHIKLPVPSFLQAKNLVICACPRLVRLLGYTFETDQSEPSHINPSNLGCFRMDGPSWAPGKAPFMFPIKSSFSVRKTYEVFARKLSCTIELLDLQTHFSALRQR